MFSGTVKYLMDANAIRSLNVATISSKKNNNRIIATIPDVKYEISSLTRELTIINLEILNDNAYLKMKEILNHPSTKKVIDYYNDKGAADVALLAHALTVTSAGVFEDEVIIVTDDVGLRTACDDLNITWKSVDDFNRL
jgi:hypothetical protein